MNRSFEGIFIPAALWLSDELTLTEKILYLEIKSLDNEFNCVCSNKHFASFLRLKAPTVSGLLSSLESKGLIRIEYSDYNTFQGRKISIIKYFNTPSEKSIPPSEKSIPPSEKSIHSNSISSNISITICGVVDYLNEKSKKQFNPKSKANASHVSARLREGFSIDDFKRVIDHKCEQWLSDDKMQKYIRPETLFGSKFDGYLNEAPKKVIESDVDYDERARETLSPLAYEKLYGRQ